MCFVPCTVIIVIIAISVTIWRLVGRLLTDMLFYLVIPLSYVDYNILSLVTTVDEATFIKEQTLVMLLADLVIHLYD